MSFWDLDFDSESIALLDESGRICRYADLAAGSDKFAQHLSPMGARSMGFHLFEPSIPAVQAYLGGLRSRQYVPLLLQPNLHPELLTRLIDQYRPDWIVAKAGWQGVQGYDEKIVVDGLSLQVSARQTEQLPPHDDLAILLSTSGSTGSHKLVRLSYDAIGSNAASIADYLGLTANDRAITTLPLAYSFGMSILNSHLAVGGSLVMTEKTLMSREFWDLAQNTAITSLSGVPSMFEMLLRAGLEKRKLSAVRMLTQAGGRLRDDLQQHFDQLCGRMGAKFFVMYGQTEASPRISYIPPDRLHEKIGSIGVPIPGGALQTDPTSGELLYSGSNVMMGYAETRKDLLKGDECCGVLRTGDVGYCDEDGFFYLTGRMKRFVKLTGTRVNLDELETLLCQEFGEVFACLGDDNQLTVAVPDQASVANADITDFLRERFDIFPGLVCVRRLASLPHTGNGKLDYQTLAKATADERV